MSNEVTRTPEQVAADINSIKFRTYVVLSEASRMAKRSAVAIGKLLEEAKCLVPHGEWGSWLKENVEYSESTANNLMRCYREYGDEQIDMISGVSDAEFYEILNQSQMVELFALPKAERRAFVEEHREELESGEMSIRDMKAEIAKLKAECEQKNDVICRDRKNIEFLEGEVESLNVDLAQANRKLAEEPIVQEVIVHRPSEEQMEAVRSEIEKELMAEFDKEREAIHEEFEEKIRAIEEERDEAVQDAAGSEKKDAEIERLEGEIERLQTEHKKAEETLKASFQKKMEIMEDNFKKKERANAAGADPSVVRIQIAMEAFGREVRAVSSVLKKMTEDGEVQKADKLRAQVETIIGKLLAEAGWTV